MTKTEPRPDRCETCRFFAHNTKAGIGDLTECRRHAPRFFMAVYDGVEHGFNYPITSPLRWCGEWEWVEDFVAGDKHD
jgi:hypothetical protein